MNDFLSKLENFLFDLLGLILPGAIFLLILISPILFLGKGALDDTAEAPVILAGMKTISDILKNYWTSYPRSALTIAVILAYLMGHTLKVFSKIKYDLLTAVFDKSINRPVINLFEKSKNKVFGKDRGRSGFFKWCKEVFQPVKKILGDVFIFNPLDHYSTDEELQERCMEIINTRLSFSSSDSNKALAKLSGVIANQENIRSLGTFYLAKYNLYRSLAFIFLFTTVYYIYFFHVAGSYIASAAQAISGIILAAPAILWFTFHVKYKKYWTLYGNERIVSLFYFLNKKQLNEG